MTNQWGRDGNLQATGSRSSSIILPVIISLILGIAGGYGGFRMLSGVSGSEITDRDRRITELEKTVSELRFDSSGDSAAADRLKAENLKLQSQIDDAVSEIEALEKTIEEAGNLRSELARASKSLRVSEMQIIELEKAISEKSRQVETLEKRLATRSEGADSDAAAHIESLTKQNRNLMALIDRQQKDARKAQAALEDRAAELTAIADTRGQELAKARADLSTLGKKLGAVSEQNKALSEEISSLKSRNKQLASEIAALKQQIAEGADRNGDLQAITTRNAALETEVVRLSDRLKKRDAEIAATESANAELKATILDLRKKLDEAMAGGAGQPTADDGNEPVAEVMEPRDADQVERAMNRMPGLDRLDADKQVLLKARLEEGACVTDALEAVFDRVPVLALRNLMRDLRSPC